MRWFNWFTAVFIVVWFPSIILMGCWALYDALTEPTAEQIRCCLTKRFAARGQPIGVVEINQVTDGEFAGTAKSADERLFRITAEMRNGGLSYEMKAENGGSEFSTIRPGFLERHPWSQPWLHLSALSMHIFGAIFAAVRFVGLREKYRPEIEVVLCVSGVGNLIFAVFQLGWLLHSIP